MSLKDIEIVDDKSATSRCDQGFLKVRRLILRNHYQDGGQSEAYNCDIVERRQIDAVAIALYKIDGEGADRKIRVLLRRGIRAPIYLRKDNPDKGRPEKLHTSIYELVAGVLEDEDMGLEGVNHRAVEEAREEVGLPVTNEQIQALGAAFFPSPGITPELVYLAAAEANIDERGEAEGDGSVMEEGATAEILDLQDAIAKCRSGEIQDAKTEIGLLRLADLIGYLPQLGLFVDELPEPLRTRFQKLGL